jgi:hypothetical protein
MKINPNQHDEAIGCYSGFGPTFDDDIIIFNNANTTMRSYSDLGACYSHPQYEHETDEAQTFLAGSFKFQLDEIEVFKKRE